MNKGIAIDYLVKISEVVKPSPYSHKMPSKTGHS